MIHIYYGYGKGKTCSAVGAGLRAYGAGLRVGLIQFFKDNQSSELSAVPFDVFTAPDSLPFHPGDDYKIWVDKAVDYIKNSDFDVVILDEFLDLFPAFLTSEEALELLGKDREYIITGHKPVDELCSIADYITCFEKKKHPYDIGIGARKGIEY